MNPFDQIKTLQSELNAAHETIADLKARLADSSADNNDEIGRLILHYGVKPAEAKMLVLLAKAHGRTLSKGWIVANSRGNPCEKLTTEEPYDRIVNVYACRLKMRGLPIKTNWGMGYYIEPQDCEPILKIAKGQTDDKVSIQTSNE